jgi:hypothetical protein
MVQRDTYIPHDSPEASGRRRKRFTPSKLREGKPAPAAPVQGPTVPAELRPFNRAICRLWATPEEGCEVCQCLVPDECLAPEICEQCNNEVEGTLYRKRSATDHNEVELVCFTCYKGS